MRARRFHAVAGLLLLFGAPIASAATSGPRAALDWSRPRRYGELREGLVVQRSPYEPMEVVLDACGSRPGASPISAYTFSTSRPGATPVTQAGCRLTVTGAAGESFTAAVAVSDAAGRVGRASAAVTIVDHLLVAAGDSYTSGEGNPDVPIAWAAPGAIAAPARWEDASCHRSRFSPAALAAAKLEDGDDKSTVTFVSAACTFHATGDVLARQLPELAARLAPPPGHAPRRVDVFTLGVGGNDMDFIPALFLCVLGTLDASRVDLFGTSCVGMDALERSFRLGVTELPARLDAVIGAIRSMSPHVDAETRIVLTEYPDPTRRAPDEWCTVMSFGDPLAMYPPESEYLARRFGGTVNEALLSAAARNHVAFTAGTWDAAASHGYCADASWVNTYEESLAKQGCDACRPGLPCLEPMGLCHSFGAVHPNEAGAEVLGDAILRALAGPSGAAVYDSSIGVPVCSAIGNACAAGPSLLGGAGATEPHAPNAVAGDADGPGPGPSIDALRVATLDGAPFAPGRRVVVRVDATTSHPGSTITLWYAGRALQGGDGAPTRTLLARFSPVASGASAFTAEYVLPEGAAQGVFALAAVPPGLAGSWDEDDLVFFTEGEDPCPSTWLGCRDSCTLAGAQDGCGPGERSR